jgi:hypothetical protein
VDEEILVGKSEEKRTILDTRRSWEGNISHSTSSTPSRRSCLGIKVEKWDHVLFFVTFGNRDYNSFSLSGGGHLPA